jgi:NADH-quinone oxidoreductase subunit H
VPDDGSNARCSARLQQALQAPTARARFGILQNQTPNLVKLIARKPLYPAAASDLPYIIAPVVSAFTALAAFAVIPFGPGGEVNGWHING